MTPLEDDLAAVDTITRAIALIRDGGKDPAKRVCSSLPELDRRARIPSARDGYGTRASGSQPGSVTHVDEDTDEAIDYGDPTGEAAITTTHPDPVSVRRRHLRVAIARMERAAADAIAALAEPTQLDNSGPWCASCARISHDDNRPWLSPPYSKAEGPTDVGGRLDKPMHLCRWCYDHVLAEGVLPPRPWLREYLATGRAPRRPTGSPTAVSRTGTFGNLNQ